MSPARSFFHLVSAVSIATALGLAAPAFAADTDGSSVPDCPKGQVWSSKDRKCVSSSSSLPDSDLTQTGRTLAKAGRYDEALEVLSLVKGNDPVALTYIGYSLRKSGRTEEGIARYHEALAIDPNNADTREYLGEGYASTGRIDLAKAELAKVEALCGRECEPYRELAEAIAAAP